MTGLRRFVPVLLVATTGSCVVPATPAANPTPPPARAPAPSTHGDGASCRDDGPVFVAPGDGVPIVCAGSQVAWGSVIGALDGLRQAGHDRFVLATGGAPSRATKEIPFPSSTDLVGPRILALTTVDLGRDGAPVAVDGRRVTSPDALEAAVRELARGAVVIRADRDAPFGSVLSVVLLVQELGETVAFGVSVEPSPKNAPAPRVKPSSFDACPFPPEADVAGIDEAYVTLEVEVDPSGHARGVRVLADPGHGFGRQARACAMAATYEPAREDGGRAIDGVVRARIHFSRPAPGHEP